MFELKDERILLYSDDRSVVLTTHRIIHHSSKDKEQIMLEDFINYELKDFHIGNYVGITIFFASITAISLFKRLNGELITDNYLLQGSLILLTISFFFLLISRRLMIRINGRFGSIEFRIWSFRKRSIKRFLEKLESEANKIKNEKENAL